MSIEVKKLKHEFLREALQKGWTAPCNDQGWLERAGVERMDRWFRRLYELPSELPIPRDRFLNHFSIGADPEFIFMSAGVREDARHLGLKAGLAFGADNNGRLVELRPEPSRSALAVLTSIWLTMHWMAAYVPQTPNYVWRSGCYAEADGLGGHVHFGRKRLHLREREVRALDRITHLLFTAGCYNREEGRLRVRQAQGGGPVGYGRQGDVRLQPWGWEYRTLPSWLDGPWLAYLSMVLGKLAVASELMPQLVQEDGTLTAEQARMQIRLILAFFKASDDDARLALAILAQRGLPQHINGGDLKANWGIFNGPLFNQKTPLPAVWPTSIPTVAALEREMALSMLEGRLPEVGSLQPTWVPNSLPKGYTQLIQRLKDTRLMPGVGEWCADVCFHEDRPVAVHALAEGRQQFRFPYAWKSLLARKGLVEAFNALDLNYDFTDIAEDSLMIAASHGNIRNMLEVRRLLMRHELLPIWPIAEVEPDSIKNWRKTKGPVGSVSLLEARVLAKAPPEIRAEAPEPGPEGDPLGRLMADLEARPGIPAGAVPGGRVAMGTIATETGDGLFRWVDFNPERGVPDNGTAAPRPAVGDIYDDGVDYDAMARRMQARRTPTGPAEEREE